MRWDGRAGLRRSQRSFTGSRSIAWAIRHCVESATFRIPTVSLVPGYRNRRKAPYTQGKEGCVLPEFHQKYKDAVRLVPVWSMFSPPGGQVQALLFL
jgi:hypothetical protein